MNANELMTRVGNGKTTSLKESVMAMFVGRENGLESDEGLEEKLIALRSRIAEEKVKLEDLKSGKSADELMKKYNTSSENDVFTRRLKFLKWLIRHHDILLIDWIAESIIDQCFFVSRDTPWCDANAWLEYEILKTQARISSYKARLIEENNKAAFIGKEQVKLMSLLENLPDESISF